jgi:hypothetical protein
MQHEHVLKKHSDTEKLNFYSFFFIDKGNENVLSEGKICLGRYKKVQKFGISDQLFCFLATLSGFEFGFGKRQINADPDAKNLKGEVLLCALLWRNVVERVECACALGCMGTNA